MRQRPDVQAAEMALVSAAAKVGVVEADLYPRLSLVGSFRSEGPTLGQAFSLEGTSWSIGPSLRWRLMDRGRIKAEAAAAQADVDASLARYEGIIVRAGAEVQTALNDIAAAQTVIARMKAQAAVVLRRVENDTELVNAGMLAQSIRDESVEEHWRLTEAEDVAHLTVLRANIKLLRSVGSAPIVLFEPTLGRRQIVTSGAIN